MKFTSRILAAAGVVAVATALACASSAAAAPITISSYVLTNVQPSGFGNWTYDADTLNDGIIPNDQNDDMLLDLSINPSITFTLNGSYRITDIQILSNYLPTNIIPGNTVSALVTIGANSAQVTTTGFGTLNPRSGLNLNRTFTLSGALASTATTTFTLSNFVADASFPTYTSLGEIVVNGASATPEPASWALMISGFGIAGGMLRRRRTALAA